MSGGGVTPVQPASQAGGVASEPDWPLSTSLELAAVPAAVPQARQRIRQVLAEWGRYELAAPAELIVSELVTNALAATQSARPSCPIVLSVRSDLTVIFVGVSDCCPLPPVRADLDADTYAEAGRGLQLVEAISSRWGWHCGDGNPIAKTVWAELA